MCELDGTCRLKGATIKSELEQPDLSKSCLLGLAVFPEHFY